MIELKNYSFSYNDRIIFCDTNITIPQSTLTLIMGESGCGKTTFLNTLCLKNVFEGEYIYKGKNMKESQNDIYKYIYYLEQNPCFIEELTIEDHFSLYNNDEQKKYLIEYLKLKDLLNKYPNQLSSGEKQRVAIAIALLSHPPILLLDEPTANLDEDFSNRVIQLLRDYAAAGCYVIVTSHDLQIKDKADVVYNIDKNEFNCTKYLIVDNKNVNLYKSDIQFKRKYYIKMSLSFLKKNIIPYFLKVIGISIIGICMIFDNTVIQFHSNSIDEISSKEIHIFKGNDSAPYSYSSNEYPILKDEQEQIKTNSYLNDLSWRMDYILMNVLDENGNFDFNHEYSSIFRLIDDHQSIPLFYENDQAKDFLYNTIFQSYDETMIIDDSKLLYKFNDSKGVYLTESVAKQIVEDIRDLKNKSLQLMIVIPYYNVDGISTITTEDGSEYNVNEIAGKKKIVTIPISGILKNNGIYDTDKTNSYNSVISIPNTYFIDKAIDYPHGENFTVYYVRDTNGKGKKYFNTVPKELQKDIEQVHYYSKWEPNSYIGYIDHLQNLDNVLHTVKESGLNARCIYLDSLTLKESVDITQRSVKFTGLIVLLFVVISQLKGNNSQMNNIENIIHYLMNNNKNKKEIMRIMFLKQGVSLIIDFTICVLLAILFVQIINYLWLGQTMINYILIAIIIIILSINSFNILFKTYRILRR